MIVVTVQPQRWCRDHQERCVHSVIVLHCLTSLQTADDLLLYCSEEDAGILHKHTDFRTNQAQVARNRKLIISSICTVANYEVNEVVPARRSPKLTP